MYERKNGSVQKSLKKKPAYKPEEMNGFYEPTVYLGKLMRSPLKKKKNI